MTTIETVITMMPMFVAPFVLMVFSFVTAYIFKFGLSKTGINGDYLLFAFYLIGACIIGGVI